MTARDAEERDERLNRLALELGDLSEQDAEKCIELVKTAPSR